MRKPRDFDAEMKVLNERAKVLKERKLHQLGELVPYLRADDCKFAFQYLAAAIRKGIIPPIPTLGEVDPVPAAKPAKPHILDTFKETT